MGCTAEILFTPRCSPKTTEFPRFGQLFCTAYGCGATGRQSCSICGKLFPHTKPPKSTFQWPAQNRRMITIFPRSSRRSKGVPSGNGVFMRLVMRELGTPKLAHIFAYGKRLYPYKILLHARRVRFGPKMSENAQYRGRMYFPTKYIRPYH